MLKNFVRHAAVTVAQQTFGRLPARASRLEGKLAIDGGEPVRDIRLRPWNQGFDGKYQAWNAGLRAAFRQLFVPSDGTSQPLAHQFIERWAAYCGCKYGLLLPHGTDALRIALAAACDHDGLGYGGEVIAPNLSFIASATAALDRRFGVALVDVEPDTLLIDPARVEAAIVPGKTRAIIPVHLFGQPANMTALREIARRHDLKIIEDAAQAHGAVWEGGPAGSLGDAAGFSFQAHKNLTCGEGGALTTNDPELYERAYSIHNVGRARIGPGRWEHLTLGWNCRPAEYQAAVLLGRLANFDRQQATRRANYERLSQLLDEVACVEVVATHPAVRRHGVYMLAMRYKRERCGGIDIEQFLRTCTAEGLPIHRNFDCTIAEQPAIRDLIARRPDYVRVLPTPVADQAVKELLYIPHQVFLGSAADMEDIAAGIRKIERHFAARPATARPEQQAAAHG